MCEPREHFFSTHDYWGDTFIAVPCCPFTCVHPHRSTPCCSFICSISLDIKNLQCVLINTRMALKRLHLQSPDLLLLSYTENISISCSRLTFSLPLNSTQVWNTTILIHIFRPMIKSIKYHLNTFSDVTSLLDRAFTHIQSGLYTHKEMPHAIHARLV